MRGRNREENRKKEEKRGKEKEMELSTGNSLEGSREVYKL